VRRKCGAPCLMNRCAMCTLVSTHAELALHWKGFETFQNKTAAGEGGIYNDASFPQILKQGDSMDYGSHTEALHHMEVLLADGVDVNSQDRHRMGAIHYNYKHDRVP
jgi:hypothetical protein